jgi:hypothetical protein
MGTRIRAYRFVECSALTQEGLIEVFEAAGKSQKRSPRRIAACVIQ